MPNEEKPVDQALRLMGEALILLKTVKTQSCFATIRLTQAIKAAERERQVPHREADHDDEYWDGIPPG